MAQNGLTPNGIDADIYGENSENSANYENKNDNKCVKPAAKIARSCEKTTQSSVIPSENGDSEIVSASGDSVISFVMKRATSSSDLSGDSKPVVNTQTRYQQMSDNLRNVHDRMGRRHANRSADRHQRTDSPSPAAMTALTRRIEQMEDEIRRSHNEIKRLQSELKKREAETVSAMVTNMLNDAQASDSESDITLVPSDAETSPAIATELITPQGKENPLKKLLLWETKVPTAPITATVQNKKRNRKRKSASAATVGAVPVTNTANSTNESQPSTSTGNATTNSSSSSSKITTTPNIVKAKAAIPPTNIDQSAHQSTANTAQTTASKSAPATSKRKRPPPIIAYSLRAKDACVVFPEKLGHNNFSLKKPNANCTHIITESNEDHAKIRSILKEGEVPFHTFTIREERRVHIILRGLCRSYTAQDVLAGLEDLNLNIKIADEISQFATERSRRNHQNTNMWLIQLEPQSDTEALLRTKKFMHQVVSFEHRKTNGVSQCRNCQHFGHSSINCSRPYRCVKCNHGHKQGECPLETMRQQSQIPIEPTCVNCKGNHPANWRGCAVYIRYINAKTSRHQQTQANRDFRQSSYNNVRRPEVSYAAAAQLATTNTATPAVRQHYQTAANTSNQQNENVLDFIEEQCSSLFGIDLGSLLQKASKFVPNYIKLNDNDKQMALLKFALSVAPCNVRNG